MNSDLLKKISASMNSFSKGQKLIGKYILDHYDKAAFMTALKLGQIVGVSESTVVRFAIELGYEGYPELQRSLQELIRTKLTSVQRIGVTHARLGDTNILDKVLHTDIDKIKATLDSISRDHFSMSVNKIISAERIYILGVRSSAPLAAFLNFYFNLIFENVTLVHTASGSEMFEQIMRINERDVILGISFPRYSKRTISALEFARTRKAAVIAITDSELSPLAPFADCLLLAKSDIVSFVDSLVAPLSVINALIVAIGKEKRGDIEETFNQLEDIWDKYDVYEKLNE